MRVIKYMGEDPKATYSFKHHKECDDTFAAFELSHMNWHRDNNTHGYKGAELLFRVHDCSDALYKELSPSLTILEKAFKNGLDTCNISKNNTDILIRNGVSMCCDVTPKIKDGKPYMDISFRYINFNPWAEEELKYNELCNGRPKNMRMSGGFIQAPVPNFHMGYFPQTALDLENVNPRKFNESFTEKFQEAMPSFKFDSMKDYQRYGESFILANGDETNTMVSLVNVCAVTGSTIRMNMEKEKEKEREQEENYSREDVVWVLRHATKGIGNNGGKSKTMTYMTESDAINGITNLLKSDLKQSGCHLYYKKEVYDKFMESLKSRPLEAKYAIITPTKTIQCVVKEERLHKKEKSKPRVRLVEHTITSRSVSKGRDSL